MKRHRRSGRLALLVVQAFVGLVGAGVAAATTDVAQSATRDAALAKFDAEVAQRVAEDAGGFASVAVFNGGTRPLRARRALQHMQVRSRFGR